MINTTTLNNAEHSHKDLVNRQFNEEKKLSFQEEIKNLKAKLERKKKLN